MEYRRLGTSGLDVSLIGLGTNNFGPYCDYEQASLLVHKALDLGINHFDTADVYGRQGLPSGLGPGAGRSEEYLGKTLKGVRRETIIATKFSRPMNDGGPLWKGTSRRYIMNAVRDSLKRLDTDYIDIYWVHLPDTGTPIEETLRALDDLVRRGHVCYVAASGFTAAQLVEAQLIAKEMGFSSFIGAQNRYNLLDRSVEADLLPVCQRYGVGFVPFFPLASGFLTGKYRQGAEEMEGTRLTGVMGGNVRGWMTDENFAMIQRLEGFAAARGHTLAELAIAWLTSNPAVSSVIAGATKPEQLEANTRAADWRLSPEEMAEVNQIAAR